MPLFAQTTEATGNWINLEKDMDTGLNRHHLEENSRSRDYSVIHKGAAGATSGLSLLAVWSSGPDAPTGKLTEATAEGIRASSRELRQALVDRVIIPAEGEMRGLGWHRTAVGEGSGTVWAVPQRRNMISSGEVIYGQRGLNPTDNIYRTGEGNVFRVESHRWGRDFNTVRELTDNQMASAAREGALTSREVQVYGRLSSASRELNTLSHIERNIHAERLVADEGMLAIRPRVDVPPPHYARVEPLYINHERALRSASAELQHSRQAYDQSTTSAWRDTGTLLAAQAVNISLDKYLFDQTPISWRTCVADAATPFMALTNAHRGIKFGVMVGTHVASRLYDRWENQKAVEFGSSAVIRNSSKS